MDISFHYFAVKSTALAAGYTEDTAQRIAAFSQFIDDYNWYAYFYAGNIPDYIRDAKLDIVYNGMLNIINPVTTGFSDWIDMGTLIIPRSQKFTVSPFHFIPKDKTHVDNGDNRTVPATLNDGSYISSELSQLQSDIRNKTLSGDDALMKMGMLFHTFADTYAHQLFTGFNNKTNSVELVQVTNNITGQDETEHYHFYVEQWIAKIEKKIGIKLPTIGHMAIAHIPDLSHLSFTMKYTGIDGSKYVYTRSNTSEFVNACRQLYQFLRECSGSVSLPRMEWDELYPKLAAGFLVDASEELEKSEAAAVKKLTAHWSSVFTDYRYSYDSESIKNGFISSTSNDIQTLVINGQEQKLIKKSYSNDFYKYNYFADTHLISLYGEHPRNWLSEQEDMTDNN